mmetsp:Transcript_13603/g.20449  ORF Transcript_13603/g.20449 Transcript_13603/m.20449 type:complete len:240 (+) Transcript_13603:1657-2376(+)
MKKARHYLVGYGSLMSTESRGKTGMLGRSWPIVVNGFRVGWSNVYPTVTYLGAEELKGSRGLGVLFEFPEDKDPDELLKSFDKREGPKYRRTRVAIDKISLWEPEGGLPEDLNNLPFKSTKPSTISSSEEANLTKVNLDAECKDKIALQHVANAVDGRKASTTTETVTKNVPKEVVQAAKPVKSETEEKGSSKDIKSEDGGKESYNDVKTVKEEKERESEVPTEHFVWIYAMRRWERRQ